MELYLQRCMPISFLRQDCYLPSPGPGYYPSYSSPCAGDIAQLSKGQNWVQGRGFESLCCPIEPLVSYVALSTDVTYRGAFRLVCKIFSCGFTDKTELTRCRTKMISRRVLIFCVTTTTILRSTHHNPTDRLKTHPNYIQLNINFQSPTVLSNSTNTN